MNHEQQPTRDEVLNQARGLSADERAEVAGALLHSLKDTKKPIAILAGPNAVSAEGRHTWLNLVAFTKLYVDVLCNERIVANERTADVMIKALREAPERAEKIADCFAKPFLQDGFYGIVDLAAQLAEKSVSRVLAFQGPSDLDNWGPEYYALIRNSCLAGASLCFNYTAHLWALDIAEACGLEMPWTYKRSALVTPDGKSEKVVLIAHDSEKPRMARFVRHYRNLLGGPVPGAQPSFEVTGTSGTVRFIRDNLKDAVPDWERPLITLPGTRSPMHRAQAHGPSGGDVVISREIFDFHRENVTAEERTFRMNNCLWNVLFFIDHKSAHPHEPDIHVLIRTCVDPSHRVNLMLNSRMAAEWAERYRRGIVGETA